MKTSISEVTVKTLNKSMLSICKEFYGPYEKSVEYIREVQDYLTDANISFQPFKILGVYFDNPSEKKPEELRSYQGVLVDTEVEVQPPFFMYDLTGQYLHTKVVGNPQEIVNIAYQSIFQYVEEHKIVPDSPFANQIMSMEGDEFSVELLVRLRE
ncbi:GyrI-like domain-containing protein [Rapidithrix thailandica]|uniref:GyrI-like domain-containing protein n=1 Tax=Rapidithrix thailandica TaxID=413964 RepID=A0AAW9S7B2_9BACT